jgi:hypothetical protein
LHHFLTLSNPRAHVIFLVLNTWIKREPIEQFIVKRRYRYIGQGMGMEKDKGKESKKLMNKGRPKV